MLHNIYSSKNKFFFCKKADVVDVIVMQF